MMKQNLRLFVAFQFFNGQRCESLNVRTNRYKQALFSAVFRTIDYILYSRPLVTYYFATVTSLLVESFLIKKLFSEYKNTIIFCLCSEDDPSYAYSLCRLLSDPRNFIQLIMWFKKLDVDENQTCEYTLFSRIFTRIKGHVTVRVIQSYVIQKSFRRAAFLVQKKRFVRPLLAASAGTLGTAILRVRSINARQSKGPNFP